MNNEVIYSPINYNEKIKVLTNDHVMTISDDQDNSLVLEMRINENKIELITKNTHNRPNELLELIALEYVFGHHKETKEVILKGMKQTDDSILGKYFTTTNESLTVLRNEFFQLRAPWYKQSDCKIHSLRYMKTGELTHPVRENPQDGYLYSRYIPEMKKTISFRVINLEKDLETFHSWHNQERVNFFWELKGTKEEHTIYIKKLLADNHMIPTIAEIDGEAYGYFELYWAYEDRLGPYYPSNQFDRGFHFLIGNSKFLGAINTDSALKSLVHLVFLDDERTTKLMAEPRADNERVIKYVDSFAVWKRLYEFDFPHKRALLIEARREVFFTGDFL